jgi:hypothetical protein
MGLVGCLQQIADLVSLTLKKGNFSFDNLPKAKQVMKKAVGLSFYSIQKTLITALKRSLFQLDQPEKMIAPKISTSIWEELLKQEKL